MEGGTLRIVGDTLRIVEGTLWVLGGSLRVVGGTLRVVGGGIDLNPTSAGSSGVEDRAVEAGCSPS